LLSRFIVKRKDITVDDVVLEGEGLTIGRLVGNDLVLNHRSVSRTHAGIKEFNGEFWLFNLSTSNGTILNGELVDKTPLADGDVLQLGRYLLQMNYVGGALSITVEMEIESHVVEGRAEAPTAGAEESGGATMLLQRVAVPGKQTVTPGGTKRLQGTGLLTGVLPGLDDQALKVFWDKRKREAGKIAEKSRLHPKGDRRVGKAQFNWRPTLDLTRPWRKSYFVWGAVIVAVLSLAGLIVYTQAYSPGAIASVHTSGTMSDRGIALRPNTGSCAECHSATVSIQNKCASCHSTSSFQPVISDAHAKAGLGCVSCHGEHMGSSFRPGLVGASMCVSCHNDTYKFAGKVIGTPHGGTVGYPVVERKWEWAGVPESEWRRLELPDTASKYTSVEQFHLIHVGGKEEGRSNCTDCHAAGLNTEEGTRSSPKAACASCHSVSFDGGAVVGPNCTSCHEQHGEARNLIASLRTSEQAGGSTHVEASTRNIPTSGWGGAQVIRQDETGARWSFARSGNVGGLPWYAWAAVLLALPVAAAIGLVAGTARRRAALKSIRVEPAPQAAPEKPGTRLLDIEKLQAEGPPYPHPVIDPILCIGCHSCVEACPHDVLAIVNGVATPVALDQCMEDTSCTVECPTSPKACIVINTKKVIPKRKVPARNQRLMTNVEGVYIIGDVSGVPLIKNALNEGAQVIDYIVEDLRTKPAGAQAEYDVAIIGIGPAGLSATAIAKQRGLRYIAIEQDKVVSTIQNYPAGKYVFFKPDTVEAKGELPLQGAGNKKETILEAWMQSMTRNGLEIQEEESCKSVKQQDGYFLVITEQGKLKERAEYKARAVVLAIGNRGTPMMLRVPGEEIKKIVQPGPALARHCPRCGFARKGQQLFCVKCGQKLPTRMPGPVEDMKVKFKLSDPDDFVGKKCIVVGAGNSAIEAAVDLTGFKRDGDKISFTRDNEVTLVVRSDFKGDLKLGNKMNVYDCIDAGRIKVFFRTEIKEITDSEVVLMDTRSKEERARLQNDYVFAMIGGEKPTKFLEGIGIKIG